MNKKALLIIVIISILITSCTVINIKFNELTPTHSTQTPQVSNTATFIEDKKDSESLQKWTSADDGVIEDPYAPELGNNGYDIKHFDISIQLDPQKAFEIIDASVIISLETTQILSEIELDFIGYTISSIKLLNSSSKLEFDRSDSKLIVFLPEEVSEKTVLDIQINYKGIAVKEKSRFVDFAPSVGFFYPDREHMFIASEPDGARYWLPCNDHPQDKATYSFAITTPKNNRGVANGILIDEKINTNGTNTYYYESNDPMASYLVTIIVGNFDYVVRENIDGIEINIFATSSFANRAKSFKDDLIDAVQWMEEKIGAYPFESLGFIVIDATGFSLETQSMILIDDQMLDTQTLVHEISHMWFGDSVSLSSWHEIWRNEGFATFIHTYYPIRNENQKSVESTFEQIRDWMDADYSEFDLDDPPNGDLFHIAEYYKAAVMVYDLYTLVGEQAFYEGLQEYLAQYKYDTASDEDFWEIMETTSGMDLDDFVNQQFMQ